MADLVSHLLVNGILGQRRLDGTQLAWFVSGAIAPDLASRVPRVILHGGLSLGLYPPSPGVRAALYGLDIPHVPVGYALVCAVVALVAPRAWLPSGGRRAAGLWLFIGGLVHLAVDMLQEHIVPAYAYLWPFSSTRFELGWISTEASLFALPVLGVLWWWTRPQRERAPPD